MIFRFLLLTSVSVAALMGGVSSGPVNGIQLETGDYLLTEAGDYLVQEA